MDQWLHASITHYMKDFLIDFELSYDFLINFLFY